MGFNNGYDSGYSDCEAENRKRWEREAVERYKAENPPSGGGSSSGSPIETIDLPAYYDPDDGYFHVDLSGLGVGETKMFRMPDPTDDAYPDYLGELNGMLVTLPEEVTQVHDSTFDLYGSPVILTPRNRTIIIGDVANDSDRDWSAARVGITRASNTTMYAWPVYTPMA